MSELQPNLSPERAQWVLEWRERVRRYIGREVLSENAGCYDNGDDEVEGKN